MDEEESKYTWRKIGIIIFVVVCIIVLMALFTISIIIPLLKD